MQKTILENEDWIIQRRGDNLYISYFEDGHFRDDIIVPISDIVEKSRDVSRRKNDSD